MKRIIRKVGRSKLVAVPSHVLELLKAKDGDYIEYVVMKNGTVKIEKGDNK